VEELTKVVDQLQKAGVRGLVLDLRNNPGGLLRSAVEVSSMFLPEGKRIVSTKGRNQKDDVYDARAPRSGLAPQTSYPIAILLNRYSASASEIVAAALQDHARAVVVGERSYGKGSVQNVIPMENNTSALKLTTASYWRPSGKNIHRFPDAKDEDEWGVRPNDGYEVKLPDEERLEYYKWRRDRDIIRRPGQAPPKKDEEKVKESGGPPREPGVLPRQPDRESPKAGEGGKKAKGPFTDRVLEKALEYLRGEIRKAGNAPAEPNNRGAELQPAPARRLPVTPALRATLEFRTRPECIGHEELR
jgi:carboxyl-terminal processing protease